jgi:hypothetical protein
MVALITGFLVSLPVWMLLWWLEGIGERRAEKRRNKAFEALRAAAEKEGPRNEEKER